MRYTRFWREKRGDWPISLGSSEGNVRKPFLLERAYDQLLYRLLRSWDSMLVLIYCFAPLSLLKAYRALTVGGPYSTFLDYARARTGANRSSRD